MENGNWRPYRLHHGSSKPVLGSWHILEPIRGRELTFTAGRKNERRLHATLSALGAEKRGRMLRLWGGTGDDKGGHRGVLGSGHTTNEDPTSSHLPAMARNNSAGSPLHFQAVACLLPDCLYLSILAK